MLSTTITILVIATATGATVMGGSLFAFSTFVMAGLGELPPAHGAAAMQEINKKAITPLFMVDLMGTAAGSAAIVWLAIVDWMTPVSPYLLSGASLYLLGVFVMTAAYHVPLNNALDAADPTTPDGAALWQKYLRDWTRWNHVRAGAGIAAGVLLVVATQVG